MRMLLIFGAILSSLQGCVRIPREYRYYSHPSKSAMDLTFDRHVCWNEMKDNAKASGKRAKVNWDELDSCLASGGWVRRVSGEAKNH